MVSDSRNSDVDMDKRIFVKGFPLETTENDLKTFFETYGIVKGVNIVKDHKSGLAKYAFVTFDLKEVQETLVEKKFVRYREKMLCIGAARRGGRDEPRRNDGGAAHEICRRFSTRQSSLDYSSSTAPMAYYIYPFYNQNAVYVPAVQASTVAQLPSPNYQNNYIPSSPQVFTTVVPGNPGTSFVQSLGSDQFLLQPMPRTNYVDGYTDYQTIPSIITVPFAPSNDWASVSPNVDGAMNVFQKECIPVSPSIVKGKKSLTYAVKEDEEIEVASDSSVPAISAVMPATKDIISQ